MNVQFMKILRNIKSPDHAKARVTKAIKALKQADARFRNFSVHVNIQYYGAFVRPDLAWNMASH